MTGDDASALDGVPVMGDMRMGSKEGRVRIGGGGSQSADEPLDAESSACRRCRLWLAGRPDDACLLMPGGVGGSGMVGGPSRRDGDDADRPRRPPPPPSLLLLARAAAWANDDCRPGVCRTGAFASTTWSRGIK